MADEPGPGRVVGFVKLTRLPLVFTAIADSAAGYVLTADAPRPAVLALLAGASACLYACGMVLNDVADVVRDRALHPERPLPSGQVSMRAARALGLALMFAGALFALLINFMAVQAVLVIFALIMVYDFYAKAWAVPGALAMGLVRASNFMLGIVAASPRPAPFLLPTWEAGPYAQALLLGGYVFFLTLMSTLEESKVRRGLFMLCAAGMAAAPVASVFIAQASVVPACGLAVAILAHALESLRTLDRASVMRNVKWGVLAIIALDATFVRGGVGWREGLAVFALLLPALALLPLFRRL